MQPLARWIVHSVCQPTVRVLCIALCGVGVHLPALHGPLIWDDEVLIGRNPLIRSPLLIFENFRHYLFADGFSTHYRPAQNISYIFDYLLWNTDTFGFHLTNVLLHVASGVLLYFLLRRLLPPLLRQRDTDSTAFIIALVWVVHPVHSAAVDYIAGRADSLAFLFAAAGWLLFLRAIECTRRIRLLLFAGAGLAALLALCSREIACVWVILFLTHLLIFSRISRREQVVTVMVCAGLLGTYIALRYLPDSRVGVAPGSGWSPGTRVVLMLRAIGDYARLLLFPAKLHMERSVYGASNWLAAVGVAVLVVFGLLATKRGVTQPARVFGVIWFLLAFLPVSNLFELNATVAEHWLYLPSVGAFIFVAAAAAELPRQTRSILVGCAVVAVIGFGARAAVRSSDWADDLAFYQRTLAAGGQSTRLLANLARVQARRGDMIGAEKSYRAILAITPEYPIARSALAQIELGRGHVETAHQLLNVSSKDYPRAWIADLTLAKAQAQQDKRAALRTVRSAALAHPDVWEILAAQADLSEEMDGPAAALSLIAPFASQHWWHHDAAVAVGRLYGELGATASAEAALRRASALDVHDGFALRLLSIIYARHGRAADALAAERAASDRQPTLAAN